MVIYHCIQAQSFEVCLWNIINWTFFCKVNECCLSGIFELGEALDTQKEEHANTQTRVHANTHYCQ